MATYKNISGDWTITVDGGVGTIYVNGNLDVEGNISYVSEIAVNDAFIAVAANNNGTVTSMGLLATKLSNTSWAGLRFNTITSEWEVSPSVQANGAPITAYAAIATGSLGVAGNDTEIQFNQLGTFGASGNLAFDYTNNKLTVQGHQAIGNVGSTPAATANAVTIYNKEQGSGDTGLYVVSSTADDELVAYKKSLLLSLIF